MPAPIDVATAVREIVGTTRRRTAQDRTAFPFFFIVGAGISAPMIPVASRIEALCRDMAERDGLIVPELSDNPMERYEKLLTLVNPNAADRQEFLHGLINSAPISPANLRLAHVLESRQLTNIVVTPNFDEMLTKALRLFGVECVVCDHPKTTQRINPNAADLLQIVHVHGTHWFYDCCNLKGEIAARASVDDADNVSMADLLNRILADRSPIVVGYSGWASDVIMTALFRWLRQPVRMHNLYWFCHRASEMERLPEWLRNHGSVRMVVESVPIEASAIFQAINTATSAKAPAVTSDPLAFFATQLEATLGSKQDDKDIYLIASVIARVRRGSELEAAERTRLTEAERRTADSVARLSDAVRRGADEEVPGACEKIDVSLLSIDQCLEVEAALKAFYDRSFHAKDELRRTFGVWKGATERALAASPESEERRAMVAFALFAETRCVLSESSEEELALLDHVLARFGDLRTETIAAVMLNRAVVLKALNRPEEAALARQELRDYFSDTPQGQAAIDLQLMNELRANGASPETLLKTAETIAAKYSGRPDYRNRFLRMVALRTQANSLCLMHRYSEVLPVADEFMKKYADESEPKNVVWVLLSKAEALTELGQSNAALEVLDEVDRRGRGNAESQSLLTDAQELRARLTAPPPP